MGPEVTRDITHPGAENETAIANSVLLKRATIDDFTRPTKDVSLSNAQVQLRATLTYLRRESCAPQAGD